MQERRGHKRVTTDLRGILRVGNQLLGIVVKDVSASGALTVGSQRLRYGAPLTLRIDKLGAFDCEQKWRGEGGRIGLGFLAVHRGIYDSLKRQSRG